jgi:DMSO/TMAO reductase YedYZ molybdopterin-dependent catalytic subunit
LFEFEDIGMKKSSLLLVLFSIFVIGCTVQEISYPNETRTHDQILIELPNATVVEYEGELSSIGDFRENSIKGPQYIDIEDYQLEIIGLVDEPFNYTYNDVLTNEKYQKIVTLNCVEGWSVNILWEGILLRDLLKNIKPEANTVIFHAYDGYTTSFPLDYFYDNDIIMAYKMNNIIIPPERGFPFVLVAEEKWGYKWIKWITKIQLSSDSEYEGYWERRGYSNTGNLNESFFR